MKKTVLCLIMAFSFILTSQAQVFQKDDKVVNLGIGLGTFHGSGYSTIIPPIGGSFEYGIVDGLIDGNASIGVGGYLGFTSSRFKYASGDYGYNYNYFILGARGAFHYQFVDKLDTYAGLMLGYQIGSSSKYGNWGGINIEPNSSSYFTYSFFVGARYYFSNSFAAFAELGYGIAALQLGVAFKF